MAVLQQRFYFRIQLIDYLATTKRSGCCGAARRGAAWRARPHLADGCSPSPEHDQVGQWQQRRPIAFHEIPSSRVGSSGRVTTSLTQLAGHLALHFNFSFSFTYIHVRIYTYIHIYLYIYICIFLYSFIFPSPFFVVDFYYFSLLSYLACFSSY